MRRILTSARSEYCGRRRELRGMDSGDARPSKSCHLVAVPFPGRGHINPMLNFCKSLVSSTRHDILISFVITEEWHALITTTSSGDNPSPRIRFDTIPNVIPSEQDRGADIPAFIEAVFTKMEDPFDRLLDRIQPPVTAILADSFVCWAVRVGNRRKIPVISFWTMSASVFSMFHHLHLLPQHGHFPVDVSERGDERVDYIPGLSTTRIADFPPFVHCENPILPRTLEALSWVARSQYLVLAAVYEMEASVIDTLKSIFPFPVRPVGPLIPYFKLGDELGVAAAAAAASDDPYYLRWLDSQPCGSVLYVSFGSVASLSSAEMDEIAAGLRDSGVRFLWVARGETSRLREACGEIGLVVPWCADQLKVLLHNSVGGFWTHCGWNSTVEGLFCGLPFLTFPVGLDQFPNSKAIVEDWKVGWRVKGEHQVAGAGADLVRREQVSGIVKRFMDSENTEVVEMKRRAGKIREICQQAAGKDGSAESNVNAFLRDLTQLPTAQPLIMLDSSVAFSPS